MVRKGILIWPVKGKQQGIPVRGHATPKNELWRSVPDFVHESSIAPDFHNYHNNFTAELFEKLC